jgi:hypothetical protein
VWHAAVLVHRLFLQELDLTGVTVLLVHFNKSWSGIIATLLEGVKHEMRVVTYAEPLRPTDEWTAASKVLHSDWGEMTFDVAGDCHL